MRIFSISNGSWLQRKATAISVRLLSPKQLFRRIYKQGEWTSTESLSGPGSELASTQELVDHLPRFLRERSIKSILDIPCGDFNWMRKIDLRGVDYLGSDIVPDVIHDNRSRYARPGVRFEVMDLLSSPLPTVDLIICRDCLVHFSYKHISCAVRSICASGSTYLATTFHPSVDSNRDIPTGYWRALNLTAPPFLFPEPLSMIVETQTERGAKALGIWKVSELPNNATTTKFPNRE